MSETAGERPPCDAEIIGRDGLPLDFKCNLPAGHLGGHAQTYEAAGWVGVDWLGRPTGETGKFKDDQAKDGGEK